MFFNLGKTSKSNGEQPTENDSIERWEIHGSDAGQGVDIQRWHDIPLRGETSADTLQRWRNIAMKLKARKQALETGTAAGKASRQQLVIPLREHQVLSDDDALHEGIERPQWPEASYTLGEDAHDGLSAKAEPYTLSRPETAVVEPNAGQNIEQVQRHLPPQTERQTLIEPEQPVQRINQVQVTAEPLFAPQQKPQAASCASKPEPKTAPIRPLKTLPCDPGLSLEDDLRRRFGSIRSALGPGTVIEGSFGFNTPVCIEGDLNGEVNSSSALIVGQQAVVTGNIHVGTLIVLGQVTGPVQADDLVEIREGGRLQGDIETNRLVIELGGFFGGRCSMNGREPSKKNA